MLVSCCAGRSRNATNPAPRGWISIIIIGRAIYIFLLSRYRELSPSCVYVNVQRSCAISLFARPTHVHRTRTVQYAKLTACNLPDSRKVTQDTTLLLMQPSISYFVLVIIPPPWLARNESNFSPMPSVYPLKHNQKHVKLVLESVKILPFD